MMDITVLASASVVATFLAGTVAYVAKLWYSHKKLIERVSDLENKRFLTVIDHDKERQICRAEVYRDVSALENAIVRVESRLDRSESQRDKAREEDIIWKQEMSKSLAEIGAILKNELYHQRMNSKAYKGP
jgi:hypothetical protein